MNTTLAAGVAIGTAGLLFVPAAVADITPVEIDWALHGEAPAPARSDTVFHLSGSGSMLLAQRNTHISTNAVIGVDKTGEEVLAMSRRITHLRTLSNGWVGPGSVAPSSLVLSWLEGRARLIGGVRGVSLIPLEDGSVALRWEEGHLDLTAEVRPDMTLYTLVDDLESDELEEKVEPLTDEALKRFLAAHGPA